MKTEIPSDLPDENPELLQADEDLLAGEIVWIECTRRCRTPQAAINWFWQFMDWLDVRWEIQQIEADEGRALTPSVANDGQVEWLHQDANQTSYWSGEPAWVECNQEDEGAVPWFKVVIF